MPPVKKGSSMPHAPGCPAPIISSQQDRIDAMEKAASGVISPIFAMSKSNQERVYGAEFLEALYMLDEVVKGRRRGYE